MTTGLHGRRAFSQFGFAQSKLWGLKNLFSGANIMGQQHRVAGGLVTAGKLNSLGRTSVDIPDPYLAVIVAFEGGGFAPRFVGRAGELYEDLVGAKFAASSHFASVPFIVSGGMPRHLGGGFYAQAARGSSTFAGGMHVISPHPKTISTPYAVGAEADGVPLNPNVGVCPLGEFTPGAFAFLFFFEAFDGGNIYIFSDTKHLDADQGSLITLAPPPAGYEARFTAQVCPIGRGDAAFLRVFYPDGSIHDAPPISPQLFYLTSWGDAGATEDIVGVDPTFNLAIDGGDVFTSKALARTSSFVRCGPDHVMFMYFQISTNSIKLFLRTGGGWAQLPTPDGIAPGGNVSWTGHHALDRLDIFFEPPLLVCFGDGCVLFNTAGPVSGVHTWYTLDYGQTWQRMRMENLPTVDGEAIPTPGHLRTVLLPYIDDTNMGEIVVVAQRESKECAVYSTTDVGETWGYRGFVVDAAAEVATSNGFNVNAAFVGTYDRHAPVEPGRPGSMEGFP